MSEQRETFQYTYSAKQQEEIRKIREKYISKEENKMEQLRRLDESATRPGSIAALALGILGALVLGVGMCCTMLWADRFFVPGIVIGVVGLAAVGGTFPLYQHMTKKRREKLAPEILRLTEELSHQLY
jgi:hypothetical protein